MQKNIIIILSLLLCNTSFAQDTLYVDDIDSLLLKDEYKPVFLAPDTIVESELVTYVVEKEYTLGYDVGVEVNSSFYNITSLSDSIVSDHKTSATMSPLLYLGLYKKGFGIYVGVSSSELTHNYSVIDSVYNITTSQREVFEFVDVFAQEIDGVMYYDSVFRSKTIEQVDTSWNKITTKNSESVRFLQLPLKVNYFYPIQNFDLYGGLGVEIFYPLAIDYNLGVFYVYTCDLGVRYYLKEKIALEAALTSKYGRINTSEESYWNKSRFYAIGLNVGVVFCF